MKSGHQVFIMAKNGRGYLNIFPEKFQIKQKVVSLQDAAKV